jgi:hypothetical protein
MTPAVIGGARYSEIFLGIPPSVVISSNALGDASATLFRGAPKEPSAEVT